jgi:hypothetical protein
MLNGSIQRLLLTSDLKLNISDITNEVAARIANKHAADTL